MVYCPHCSERQILVQYTLKGDMKIRCAHCGFAVGDNGFIDLPGIFRNAVNGRNLLGFCHKSSNSLLSQKGDSQSNVYMFPGEGGWTQPVNCNLLI